MSLDFLTSIVTLALPFIAGGILWLGNKAFGISKTEAARKTLTAALERAVAAMAADVTTQRLEAGAAEIGVVPDKEGVVSYVKQMTPDALKTLGMNDRQLQMMIDAEYVRLQQKG